jgi:hypothetical protein
MTDQDPDFFLTWIRISWLPESRPGSALKPMLLKYTGYIYAQSGKNMLLKDKLFRLWRQRQHK